MPDQDPEKKVAKPSYDPYGPNLPGAEPPEKIKPSYSIPPNMRVYTDTEVEKGMPKQEGYRLIPPEWGMAMSRQYHGPNQAYFAQDPKRLAKFYYFSQSVPDGWEFPDWFDSEKYAEAFNYMSELQGDDWASWKPFDEDDPSSIYLTTLPEPPKDFRMENEGSTTENLMDYINSMTVDENGLLSLGSLPQSEYQQFMDSVGGAQGELSPFMQPGTWQDLEPWQRLAMSIFSPQPMEDRPEGTRWTASLFQGAQAGMGGYAAGAVVGGASAALIGAVTGTAVAPGVGTVVGLLAGLGVGAAATYQAQYNVEIPGINKILEFLDMAAIGTEKAIGVAIQLADDETGEVLSNLPEAWKAAEFTYEASPFGTWTLNLLSGGAQVVENVLNGIGVDVELSSGQMASFKAGEIWALERAITEPIMVENGVLGGESLDKIRSRMISGEDPLDLYAEYVSYYGFSGTVGDFFLQSVLDPLQFVPSMQGAAIGKIASNIKDPGVRARLLLSVEMNKGSIGIDALPFGVQGIVSAITGKKGSGGAADIMRTYRNIIRHGVLPLDYMPTKTVTSPQALSLTNPELFTTPGDVYFDIVAKQAEGADTNAVQGEFRTYVEGELVKAGVDVSKAEVKTVVDGVMENVDNVVLEALLNEQGTTEADLRKNLNYLVQDYLDDTVGSMKWGEDSKQIKYYPERTPWERTFAGLTDDSQYAELQRNQSNNWFKRLTSLTPSAQVAIFLDLYYTNTAGVLTIYGNTPEEMISVIRQIAGIDVVQAGLVGEAMISSPATKTTAPALKAFYDSGVPEQMLATWMANTESRTMLEVIARGLDRGIGDMLQLIEDNPSAVIEMIKNSNLRGLIDDINNGVLNPDTLKDRMKPFTDKNPAPFTAELFEGELLINMLNHADKWLVDHYGIKPGAWYYRLSAAMKSAQSLWVLGFNPIYTLNNYINNASTRAAQGVFGFLSKQQIDRFWDKFGVRPAGFEKGVGMAGLPDGSHMGGKAMAAAMETGDWIDKFRSVSSKAARLGIFSNLAAKIEVAESRQATTIGAMDAWSRLWKQGVGYEKMSPTVEAELRRIHPNLPERLYSLVNQGLNIDEITKSLYSRSKFQGVESAAERAIQQIFTNNPQRARDIIEKSGIKQELINAIGENPTIDDINSGFDYVKSRLDAIIEKAFYEDLADVPEDVSNRIKAEGWAAMMPLWSELWGNFTIRRMDDLMDNQRVAQMADALRANGDYESSKQLWRSHLAKSDQNWKRTHSEMLQSAKGMIDAIGTQDPNAEVYVNLMSGWMEGWEKFYADRNVEWHKYYTSGKSGDNRKNLYKLTADRISKMYEQHVKTEQTQLKNMFDALGKVYEQTSHRPMSEVMAWGEGVMSAWDSTAKAITEFRKTIQNTEATPAEVRRMFDTFNSETFRPLIQQQRNAIVEGAYQLSKLKPQDVQDTPSQTRPVQPAPVVTPEVKYPGAEALRSEIIERASRIGDYTATDSQRKLLASLLSRVFKSADDRHAVQRYLFDTQSVKDANGSRVKAALDLLVAVDEQGNDVRQMPDNIKAQLAEVLQAARESEGQGSLYDGKPADNASESEKAQYNEKNVNEQSQKVQQERQTHAEAVMNRSDFKTKIQRAFNLSREETSAVMALVDAHAEVWGKRQGKNTDSWYVENIAGIETSDIKKVVADKLVLGETNLIDNGKRVITAFKNADIVTAMHELAHVFSFELDAAEKQVVIDWTGIDNYQEPFADGFVKYLANELAIDVAPPAMLNIFQKFGKWLTSIINSLTKEDQAIYPDISPEMKRLYDRLLFDQDTTDYRKALSEKLKHYPTGDVTKAMGVKLPDKFDMRFKIVELTELVTSHFADFTKNDLYPQELQARFREMIGNQTQVLTIINEFDPDKMLIDTRETDTGPMVIGQDMVVESGNGRTIALMKMLKDYPDKWQSYLDALPGYLEEYGFSPEALEGVQYPVLVRERLTDIDRVAFADDANQRRTGGMSILENAFVDAKKWENALLGEINIARSNDIYTALRIDKNKAIVQAFLDKTPAADKVQMIDAYRKLSTDGARRVIASLYAYLFPGEKGKQIVHLFSESTSPASIKNLRTAVDNALPELAKLEAKVRQGVIMPEMSLSQDIADVIMAHVTVTNRHGSYAEFQKFWEQSPTVFGESYVDIGLIAPDTTPEVRQFKVDLFHFFAENTRKTEPQSLFFKMFVEKVLDQPQYMADQIEIFPVERTPKHIIASEIFQTLVTDGISNKFEGYEPPRQQTINDVGPTLYQTTKTNQEIIDIIKQSPNFKDADIDWDRYANQWGIRGNYVLVDFPVKEIRKPGLKISKLDIDYVAQIKNSYKSGDSIAPIIVSEFEPTRFAVLDGTHHLKAFDELGIETIPAYVPEGSFYAKRQQGPTLYQTRVIGDVPVDGTPIPQYEGRMRAEAYQETLYPLIDQMHLISIDDMENGTAFSLGDIPDNINLEVQRWMGGLRDQMAGTKLASMRYGEMQRNRALLNYQQRYGIDDVAQMFFPYEFWFTRTMGEWAKRAIEKPAWIAMYARLRRHQKRMEQEGIPSRLKGKMRIPAAFLPDWMGDGLYIDPLKQLFPFSQFAAPFEMASQQGMNVEYAAISNIENMVKEGYLTATQAQKIVAEKNDPIWNQAIAEAQVDLVDSGGMDAMSLASMMMTPAMWWTYPYHILKGTPEQLYPLPGTRTGQALREWGGPLGVIGNIMALPEETIRKKFNLSNYGEWGDYYVDRTLANMAAEGVISTDDALLAMMERKGEAYDLAYGRVQREMALKIPGSQTAEAIKAGKIGGILYTLPTTIFPAGLLPEGELLQRGLKAEYAKAWDDYEKGNPRAINDFFEEHPEYQARLALFDKPEERLQQFLVSEIWEKWFEIDNKNKQLVIEQLGSDFEMMFLNEETQDYTAIDPKKLAQWARLLGGVVPDVEATQGDGYQGDALKLYKPAVLAQVEEYYSAREEQFPNYKFLQDIYFGLPEEPKSMRYGFLDEYPELKAYWDWKEGYLKTKPDVQAYLDEQEKRYENNDQIYTSMTGATQSNDEIVTKQVVDNMLPALQMQLMFEYYSGNEVSGGAKTMLAYLWESLGRPGDSIENWMDMVMSQLLE